MRAVLDLTEGSFNNGQDRLSSTDRGLILSGSDIASQFTYARAGLSSRTRLGWDLLNARSVVPELPLEASRNASPMRVTPFVATVYGRQPSVHATAWAAHSASVTGSVQLGGRDSLWSCVSVRGDLETIEIGRDSNVQDWSAIHADKGFPLRIAESVSVGHGTVLCGCTVGDRVLGRHLRDHHERCRHRVGLDRRCWCAGDPRHACPACFAPTRLDGQDGQGGRPGEEAEDRGDRRQLRPLAEHHARAAR
jgi:hypothetical protein